MSLSTLLANTNLPAHIATTNAVATGNTIAKKKGQILFCKDTGNVYFDIAINSGTVSRLGIKPDLSAYTTSNNISLNVTDTSKSLTLKHGTGAGAGSITMYKQNNVEHMDITVPQVYVYGDLGCETLISDYMTVGLGFSYFDGFGNSVNPLNWERSINTINQSSFTGSDTFGKYMEFNGANDVELYDADGFKVEASIRLIESEDESGNTVLKTRVYIPSNLPSGTISGWHYLIKPRVIMSW